MIHKLKIWPKFYTRVLEGSKTFEVRVNDRDFQSGDLVVLHEWCPRGERYTGNTTVAFRIGYILPIDEDRVVFSLLNVESDD